MKIHLEIPKKGRTMIYETPYILTCDGKNNDFYLISIETDKKGPIYTIIDKPIFQKNRTSNNPISIQYELIYGFFESPPEDSKNFIIPQINTVGGRSNILPFLLQLYSMRNFMDENEIFEYIEVGCIDIVSTNKSKHIHAEDGTDVIRKKCKQMGLETLVQEITGHSAIIFYKNGVFERNVVERIGEDQKFEFLFFPLPYMECGYLLTRKEVTLFSCIRSMHIEMLWEDEQSCNSFTANTFSEILKTFLFFPQLLLIEDALYHSNPGYLLEVTINVNDALFTHQLVVTSNEIKTGLVRYTSLFYIVKHFVRYLLDII